MRGTRRTIVTATAAVAVVLGVGGVAAATGSHSSSADVANDTSTSVSTLTNHGGQHPHGRALGIIRKQLEESTSTTVADDTTTTTVNDGTTTTSVEDTSTTMPVASTTTTVAGEDDHGVCDHAKQDADPEQQDEQTSVDHARTTRADASARRGFQSGHDQHRDPGH